MRLRAVLALPLLFAGLHCGALAHDVPPSMVMLDIGRSAIDVELQLPLSELGAGLALPLASNPGTVVSQYGPRIEQYVADGLQIHSRDGRAYQLHVESLGMKATNDARWTSKDWLVLRGRLQAPSGVPTEVFALDYNVILQRVVSHQVLIYVRRDIRNGLVGDKPMLISTAGFGNTHIAVDGSDGSWWQGLRRLFSLGMRHIAEGPDHLLFLLALLLPSSLVASAGRWRTGKSAGASVRTIVGVVSGFTLGHSISLALASAGWVAVPVRLVEVLIAVSVLVSCAHAWRPLFAGREVWIASGFGLVHGLAFAEVLSGLDFDATTLTLSLVGFNLGIEAMQLLVIAATLPLMLLSSTVKHHAGIRIAGAGFAAICAVGWILERAFGLSNPLQPVVARMAPPPAWFVLPISLASAVALCILLVASRSRSLQTSAATRSVTRQAPRSA
jgi:hypothetical protein